MTWRIEQWDVARTPWPIEDESVQCVVTSPPYWGLRDYGTATWEGGDLNCNHTSVRRGQPEGTKEAAWGGRNRDPLTVGCAKCGARRIDSQIGLERTPDEYVEKIVAVFREIRRVLRKDGTVWLNLGDSYANDTKWGGMTGGKHVYALHGEPVGRTKRATGLKPKDLVGIPWRVAFALQADGWWLRSDIVWAKPNPMPESVTDRPTRAHEYVFLLTKSAKYYYDADAIAEQSVDPESMNGRNRRNQDAATQSDPDGKFRYRLGLSKIEPGTTYPTRNARTVWNIATEPYPEAHFATFPTELARRCILAGSKPGDMILDPFAGSGTVALVADTLGRNSVGLELNPKYVEMARQRVSTPRTSEGKEAEAMESSGQIAMFTP